MYVIIKAGTLNLPKNFSVVGKTMDLNKGSLRRYFKNAIFILDLI